MRFPCLKMLCLCCYAFISTSALAQKLQINTRDCQLSASNINTLNKLARYESQLYNYFFETDTNDSLSIKVTLLNGKSDYYKALQKFGDLPHKSSGVYYPHINEAFVCKSSESVGVIIHEASHCFLHHNFKNPPRWINEGIAEFFETLSVQEGQVVFSPQAGRIRRIQYMIFYESFSLKKLFYEPDSKWRDVDKRTDLYSLSYSVVYFLIKKDKSKLKDVLNLMKEGYNSEQAIEISYGSFSKFESDFFQFYKHYNIS